MKKLIMLSLLISGLSVSAQTVDVATAAVKEVSCVPVSALNMIFLFIGAVMVFSMHAGFAFLELGTVRKKNQVNALQKIIFDWGVSTMVFFLFGYQIASGINLLDPKILAETNGVELMKFFFFLTFAACIPAIISGGIAERAKFWPMVVANSFLAGLAYPFCHGALWSGKWGIAAAIEKIGGAPFTDFAGSVVVHSLGGWLALPAIILLGARRKRYTKGLPPASNIPFLALGSWILCVGWFGFNVVSGIDAETASGLVAVNSLMAMVGGIIGGLIISKNDAGFTHNGALAGLIAICAGSAVVHPLAAFAIGVVASAIFYFMFTIETEKFKIDDVLGVWPLHGIVGSWGGIAAGIFGHKSLGAQADLSFTTQLLATLFVIVF
jgi:Amt family ammonium transporter